MICNIGLTIIASSYISKQNSFTVHESHAIPNVTGYSCARRAKCIRKCILNSLTKNLECEEREQLDSGGGGALSQGAGHEGSFFDSIILGKFICCLAREKR